MTCKRNAPGKGCCGEPNEVCCVENIDLPEEIAFEGQTRTNAGLIINSDPCCRVYQPFIITEDFTRVKSAPTAFDERHASATQETTIIDTQLVDFAGPARVVGCEEVPECDVTPRVCSTIEQVVSERLEQSLYVIYQRGQLTVVIFKAFAKCAGDDEPVCRWFIVTVMTIGGKASMVNNGSFDRAFTGTNDGCCVTTGLGHTSQLPATDDAIFDSMELPFGGISGFGIGAAFYSAKTYLTLPTGAVTFDAGETVEALDENGNQIITCVPLTNDMTEAVIHSYNPGPFPLTWTPPTVATMDPPFQLSCWTTARFTNYGGTYTCRVVECDTGIDRIIQNILPGNRIIGVGGGPLLMAGFPIFLDGVCRENWCPGMDGWVKAIIADITQNNLTSSRSYQDYTPQTVVIPGGSWTVTFS